MRRAVLAGAILVAATSCSSRERAAPPADAAPAVEPPPPPSSAVEQQRAARDRLLAVRDRYRLLNVSADGTRALLGVLSPVARTPAFRSVDIATNQVLEEVDLVAFARLPRRPMLARDFDITLRAAISGNRALGRDLAEAAAVLAAFPLGRAGDFAASPDGAFLAYAPDDGDALYLASGGNPAVLDLRDATDPWMAPDGTHLLYRTGDPPQLAIQPLAGGARRLVAGVIQLRPALLPDGTIRTLDRRARKPPCVIDIDVARATATRRACLPRDADPIALELSADGAWLVWAVAPNRLRVLEVATGKVRFDTTAIDYLHATAAKQLRAGPGGRVYVSVDDRGYAIDATAPTASLRAVPHDPALVDCAFATAAALVCARPSGDVATIPWPAVRRASGP